MTISSEWTLLDKIKKMITNQEYYQPEDLITSIGDDCAVFEIGGSRLGLLTTDISIEEVHFKRTTSRAEDIGYKAMMANISDIAAMAGTPRFAVISLGLPADATESYVLQLYEGMLAAATHADLHIIGGDIAKSAQLVLNIAVYGEVHEKHVTRRSGAQIGNHIYLTGHVGDSLAGLNLLSNAKDREKPFAAALIEQHKRPHARYNLVHEIIHMFAPTAMIDISDGLLADLGHICEMSHKGFLLEAANIPMTDEFRKYCEKEQLDPITTALGSGEEYELLFTSVKHITHAMGLFINSIPITEIGTITSEGYVLKQGDTRHNITIDGFDHFKEQP
jgi:thiamine-monophosphate kinase